MSETPIISFPAELPICAHRFEIERALRDNRVVIVCGDTGSGKTTQLPKMALEIGRAAHGRRIACTQPRRLAAVTVARRVAEEFSRPVGEIIGYQHRFERKTSPATRVKFMTDGVLLAETRSDPLLSGYDTIIIDEAHERSLNIDFLLGIIRRILDRRRDLLVVVSSATLDADSFSRFFDGAPVLKVPGRLYPIEMRYMAPPEGEESDLARDVLNAVDSLPDSGDVLVFLPGERDIRECAETLTGARGNADDVIPLIASLPASEQQRAFRLSAKRRIILATNVAETSVTIPGIRYVVDSGLARVSRYIHRTQVQRLQIEPVSQASANQRSGRCGRVGPGVCIRLYSEEDFARRDEYTPPEILRSSLAGVILSMLDLKLGDISRFPFIDPPEPSMIKEGVRELLELGAISQGDDGISLTTLGRRLAAIPVEPRLARMLLAAEDEKSVKSVIPLVAAMACDDPRRRPIDEKDAADAAHAKFKAPESDFAGMLKLWRWWERESSESSQSKLRKTCKANFLSYPKMREWRDLSGQLDRLAKRLGIDTSSDSGDDAAIHRALLSGLLGRIGLLDPERRDYRGARGIRFSIFPGSVLFKKSPQWIMAGELVDTSRLYAREAATIDPKWIEPIAGGLCRHSYHSPEWDAQHGFTRATEQVTLYGLVIVQSRRCDFSRIDPVVSRDLFVRHGLVGCEFPRPPSVVRDNIALLTSIRDYAEKTRSGNILDEERLYAHFDTAVPNDICSADGMRKWLRHATADEIEAIQLKPDDWFSKDGVASRDFPDSIRIGDARMSLTYRHSLSDDDDGITCTAPASKAALLRDWRSDWLVPGALPEKIGWMLSCLPSAQRRILSPIDDSVSRLMTYLRPGQEPLKEAVCRVVHEQWGIRIAPDAWDNVRTPAYFSVRFRIRDDASGRIVASGRDLESVLTKAGIAPATVRNVESKTDAPHTTWDFGALKMEIDVGRAGWAIRQYPALHDDGTGVSVTSLTDPEKAMSVHRAGLARLFVLALGKNARAYLRFRQLPVQAALYLQGTGYDKAKFEDDFLMAISSESFVRALDDVRDAPHFKARFDERLGVLSAVQAELSRLCFDIVTSAAERNCELDATQLADLTRSAISNQLSWLVFPGFVRHVPLAQLRHYTRYLDGIRVRIQRARLGAATDAEREALVAPFWNRYRDAVTSAKKMRLNANALFEYRWMVEEYRISVFAQELRTPTPISPKRLDAKWQEVVR